MRLALVAVASLAFAGGAGPRVSDNVDVSNDSARQAEVTIAADPRKPDVLLAGSNSFPSDLSRVYSSTDGGKSWSSLAGPPPPRGLCDAGDPAVGIDGRGRQYYAFLADDCNRFVGAQLYVAHRDGPDGSWTTPAAGASASAGTDDKPDLAVDVRHGFVYVVRQRLLDVVLSRSRDGTSWKQTLVSSRTAGVALPAIAVGDDGALYVAWFDQGVSVIRLTRAVAGGRFRPEKIVAQSAPPQCAQNNGVAIPAQAHRCVLSIPHLAFSRGRLYLVYDDGSIGHGRDVYVTAFDRSLRRVLPVTRVNPPDGRRVSDQFLPAVAVDRANGRLWICFYDTRGQASRRVTRYSCTWSEDRGAHWRAPVRVASVASNERAPLASFFEYGEYTGVVVTDGVAHPIWTDSRDLETKAEEIYTATVTP